MAERSENTKVLSLADVFNITTASRFEVDVMFKALSKTGDRVVFQPPSFGRIKFSPSYLLFHPEDVTATWVENQKNLDKRGPIFEDLRSIGGDNLFLMEGRRGEKVSEDWKTKQKLIGRNVQPRGLAELKGAVQGATAEMLDGLQINPTQERVVPDLYTSFKYLGLQLSAHFLLGTDVGQDEAKKICAAFSQVHHFAALNTVLGRLPNYMYQRVPFLFGKIDEANQYLNNYAAAIAESSASPLVKALINHSIQNPNMDHNLYVRNEILGVLGTSFSTTAAATAWTLSLLSLPENAAHQTRVREEVRDGVALENPQTFTYRALQEGLRLYPPAYSSLRRVTQSIEVETVNGKLIIPPEANLGVVPFIMHRDPRFWDDPERYNPDRFLEKPARGSYMPFGLGERRCIGEHYATFVATNFIGTVLEQYQLSSVQFPNLEFSSSLKPTPNGAVNMRKMEK